MPRNQNTNTNNNPRGNNRADRNSNNNADSTTTTVKTNTGSTRRGGGGPDRSNNAEQQRRRPRHRGGGGRPRPTRAETDNKKTIQAIRDSYSAMGVKVYAFLDHTNINIMTQKASGREHNFPEGVDDMCVRVVPSKIFDFLKTYHASSDRGRDRAELAQMSVYTSDNTVAGHENIGGRKIIPRVFRKGGWNNREKIVDTYMVADAVETIFQKKDPFAGIAALTLKDQIPGIISLWTGDMDILCPVVDKALSAGWKVEVWSFKGSMSNVVERYPTVVVNELDSIVSEISERKTGWKPNAEKIPPPNACFKLRFELDSPEMEITKEHWREIVDCLSRRVDLPLQAWFNWDEALMFLILAVPGKELHNYMKIIWDRKDGLLQEVQTFMKNKRVKSNCRVIIDGSYPQQPQFSSSQGGRPPSAGSANRRGGGGGGGGGQRGRASLGIYGSEEEDSFSSFDYGREGNHFPRGYSGRGRGRGGGN